MKEKVDNWGDYDTVLIGYPIWWGIAAWPVDTFVKANSGNWLEGHRLELGHKFSAFLL